MAKPASAATEARKAREAEERRRLEAHKLKLHNERVKQAEEAGRTRRVMGVRRVRASATAAPEAASRQMAWWCQPKVHALMERMQTTTAQHPRPSGGCPECGGVRIRWQTDLGDGTVLFVCPIDWSPSIQNTGCGRRFAFNPRTGSKTTQDAHTGRSGGNVPQNTGDEFDPSDFEEWPE